jgi:subtilisin family serine protease
MAKRKGSRRKSSAAKPANDRQPVSAAGLDGDISLGTEPDAPQPTGRMIVTVLGDGDAAMKSAIKEIRKRAGVSSEPIRASSFGEDDMVSLVDQSHDSEMLVLDELGIIVANLDPDQSAAMPVGAAGAASSGVVTEPEFWCHALGQPAGYLTGYRDAVNSLVGSLLEPGEEAASEIVTASSVEAAELAPAGASFGLRDDGTSTWGLKATNVAGSRLSGRGIRVAILDSGFDANHRDYRGRAITTESFISDPRQSDRGPGDKNGHGTHCVGSACGPRNPATGVRGYGVAHEAEIFSGKVLAQTNGGASGTDGWILAGINWALRKRCHVISMSLGGRPSGSGFPQMYDNAGRKALRQGCVILAAAGNDSNRLGRIPNRPFGTQSVSRPANCPAILSVAAVDSRLGVAEFSNRAVHMDGGEINLAGPGVGVFSSTPGNRHRFMDGTSQATPHVAGILALVAEETGMTGVDLYKEVRSRARRLTDPKDTGSGLARL